MRLLMQFNASGVTVVFATHDEGLLETFDFPRLLLWQGTVDRRSSIASSEPSERLARV